ncbi:MAG: glycosyltransferase family 4 protein [Nocardioidaceae bacterium]
MRVLMVSWEYPPLVYGGLARHVHALSTALARLGHDVVVLTQQADGDTGTSGGPVTDQRCDGVRVIRVRQDPPHLPIDDLLAWTMGLDHALTRGALTALGDWRPDVVHAHDWLVAHTAANLQAAYGCPLVATVHATEAGRWQGWLPAPLNRAIHTVEWWLTWSADRVVVCSDAMAAEVSTLFAVPEPQVEVIANGVDADTWSVPPDLAESAADQWRDGGPLLVYSGRLEYEKGVLTVLAALRRIRRRHAGTRLVVAGRGGQEEALRARVKELRLGRAVRFTGWLDDDELTTLVAGADVALVPSSYEPFGLVALEAAAAGTVVVAADVGGLAEVVDHETTGLLVDPEDPTAWVEAVCRVLADADLRAGLEKEARLMVERDFRWADVAERTLAGYHRAGLPTTSPRPRPSFEIAEGNQLFGARGG